MLGEIADTVKCGFKACPRFGRMGSRRSSPIGNLGCFPYMVDCVCQESCQVLPHQGAMDTDRIPNCGGAMSNN